jgi:predicted thioesterase
MTNEATFEVKEEHSALQLGSGSLRVLATPMMIRFMELISHQLLAQTLPDAYSSVGVHVDVRHLAPTPIDKTIRVRCEILEVKERGIRFSVSAWDNIEKIGEGQHKRVIIEVDRFFSRVEAKMNSS